MLDAYLENSNRVLSIHYEALVNEPKSTFDIIFNYLEMETPKDIPQPVNQLFGRLGDPTGSKEFSDINQTPLNRWKTTFSNPLRRLWGKRYLEWLGSDRLSTMGYDIEILKRELHDDPKIFPNLFTDLVRMPVGELYNVFEPHIVKDKLKSLLRKQRPYCLN